MANATRESHSISSFSFCFGDANGAKPHVLSVNTDYTTVSRFFASLDVQVVSVTRARMMVQKNFSITVCF